MHSGSNKHVYSVSGCSREPLGSHDLKLFKMSFWGAIGNGLAVRCQKYSKRTSGMFLGAIGQEGITKLSKMHLWDSWDPFGRQSPPMFKMSLWGFIGNQYGWVQWWEQGWEKRWGYGQAGARTGAMVRARVRGSNAVSKGARGASVGGSMGGADSQPPASLNRWWQAAGISMGRRAASDPTRTAVPPWASCQVLNIHALGLLEIWTPVKFQGSPPANYTKHRAPSCAITLEHDFAEVVWFALRSMIHFL